MPKEYDFMKSSAEKEMPDSEYKTLRDEYDKKAEALTENIKKTLIAFLVIYAISFVILYLLCMFNSEANYGAGVGNYTWLIVEFLLVIFFYGLSDKDYKKYNYETDKRVLLNQVKAKIQMNKIKLGLVIGLGIVFLILNIICWWIVIQFLRMPVDDFGLMI